MKLWTKLRTGLCLLKGTPERIHEPGFGWKVIRERRKRKRKEKGNISKVQRLIGQTRIQYFEGSAVFVHMEFNISKGSTVLECSTVLERMEFNILKVQRSLNVWNLTFRRFTPASTLALDI
ncbi:uncharacterized protein OCT59_007266 [Rhizophagus irregularis]|uniref:uncharacterized protein n=1 Tax=Rhizophagus irregularis TaxID=588596 RepID=UPI00332AA9B5|nr:hypothetical protein OCT59_007266 [Rhizophagus irregularis]